MVLHSVVLPPRPFLMRPKEPGGFVSKWGFIAAEWKLQPGQFVSAGVISRNPLFLRLCKVSEEGLQTPVVPLVNKPACSQVRDSTLAYKIFPKCVFLRKRRNDRMCVQIRLLTHQIYCNCSKIRLSACAGAYLHVVASGRAGELAHLDWSICTLAHLRDDSHSLQVLLPDGSVQWPLRQSHRRGLHFPLKTAAHLQLTGHTECRLVLPDGSEHARPLSSGTKGVSMGSEWAPLYEAMNLASGQILHMRAEGGTSPVRLHLSVTRQSLQGVPPVRSRPKNSAGMQGNCVTWLLQRAVDDVADTLHIPPSAMALLAIHASNDVEILVPGHEEQPLGSMLKTYPRGHGKLRMSQRNRSRAGLSAGRLACVRAESGGDTLRLHISGSDAPVT